MTVYCFILRNRKALFSEIETKLFSFEVVSIPLQNMVCN